MTLLDPKERTARGLALQAEITGKSAPEATTPYEESIRDFAFAEVWNRPGLDRRSRVLIALAGTSLCDFPPEAIDDYVRGALKSNVLTQSELREAALHMAVYGGWGRGGRLDAAITRVERELGLSAQTCPPIRGEAWNPEERIKVGEAEFVNVMTFPGGPPMTPFLEAISNFVFGEMWCRPGLDQRSRRWLTLVGVAESGAEIPIKSHFHAAMASGNCSPEEIQEFLVQYGLFAGWPKASVLQPISLEMSKKVAAGLPWNG